MWINHCVMLVMLPLPPLYYHLKQRREDPTLPATWLEALKYLYGIEIRPLVKALTWLALVFAVGDYMWYVALGHTSVALGSCVYNSQCVFAYLLSIPILNESVKLTKASPSPSPWPSPLPPLPRSEGLPSHWLGSGWFRGLPIPRAVAVQAV